MTLIQNHSNQEALNHSQGCFLDTRTFCDAGKLMSEVFLQWAVPLFSPHERCERGGIHVYPVRFNTDIFLICKCVGFMSKPSIYGNLEYMKDVAFLHLVITYHAEEEIPRVSCFPKNL